MSYTSNYRFTPGNTPVVIKNLIILTCAISLFSTLTNTLFTYIFGTMGPQEWLSLSWWGIKNLYIWQFISYLFVQYSSFEGVTFSYLVNLSLSMYFLWIVGSIIQERVGTASFLRLYLLSGIFAGILALLSMYLIGYSSIAGAAPALLALLAAWTMLDPDSEIILFSSVPVQTKWLATAILGGALLICLSQLNISYFILYLSGALFGYLYALLAWNLIGPFPFTRPFDQLVAGIGIQIRQKINKWKGKPGGDTKKIIPFPLDDEQFVDAMLQKISKFGESSLSWMERCRLNEISKRKSDKH